MKFNYDIYRQKVPNRFARLGIHIVSFTCYAYLVILNILLFDKNIAIPYMYNSILEQAMLVLRDTAWFVSVVIGLAGAIGLISLIGMDLFIETDKKQ